jgi:CheY-like chemotaxis protein
LKDLKNILLVDQSNTSRIIMKRFLEKGGYSVCVMEAADGIGAYSLLTHSEKDIDLVIASLMLPRMSGITLLKKIRGSEKLRKIPVIIVTVSGRKEIEKKLEGCNICGYVEKPLEYESFIKAAGDCL